MSFSWHFHPKQLVVALLQGQIPLEYPGVKCLAQGHIGLAPAVWTYNHELTTPSGYATTGYVFCECNIHNMEEIKTHTIQRKNKHTHSHTVDLLVNTLPVFF